MSNYIHLYKPNMSWATLHSIWFFREWNPYDSRHVQQIKKERHLDFKIPWTDTRSFIHFESHKLFHTSFAFKNCNHQFMLFHLSMSFEFHAFHMSLACYKNNSCFSIFKHVIKNYHVMEITIGHSNHIS